MMGVPLGLGTGWPGRLWQSEGTTEAEPGCGHPCWAGTGGTGLGLGMVSPPGWQRGGWWEAPTASPNHIPVLGGQKPAALGQRHVVPEGCQTLMSPSHMEQTAGSGWGGGRLCTPHPNSHRTVNPFTSTHLRNCATRCSKGGCETPPGMVGVPLGTPTRHLPPQLLGGGRDISTLPSSAPQDPQHRPALFAIVHVLRF